MNVIQLNGAKAHARALRVQLQDVGVKAAGDFEAAFKNMQSAGAVLHLESPLFVTHRARIAELAMRHRLPGIYGVRDFVDTGGLMSYGAHLPDLYGHAAAYIDKIFKGARPGDLPVEQPTRYDLVINMKTANALGVKMPQSLLLRADQVVQ